MTERNSSDGSRRIVSRRSILRTAGIVAASGTIFSGSAAAELPDEAPESAEAAYQDAQNWADDPDTAVEGDANLDQDELAIDGDELDLGLDDLDLPDETDEEEVMQARNFVQEGATAEVENNEEAEDSDASSETVTISFPP